jgi:hypothetical protein
MPVGRGLMKTVSKNIEQFHKNNEGSTLTQVWLVGKGSIKALVTRMAYAFRNETFQ